MYSPFFHLGYTPKVHAESKGDSMVIPGRAMKRKELIAAKREAHVHGGIEMASRVEVFLLS